MKHSSGGRIRLKHNPRCIVFRLLRTTNMRTLRYQPPWSRSLKRVTFTRRGSIIFSIMLMPIRLTVLARTFVSLITINGCSTVRTGALRFLSLMTKMMPMACLTKVALLGVHLPLPVGVIWLFLRIGRPRLSPMKWGICFGLKMNTLGEVLIRIAVVTMMPPI